MALAAFFLVASEDHRSESRDAALLYLIAAHVGTLVLFALFALWRWATGSYALDPVGADVIGVGVLNGLFLLALTGFGLKAGMMPLHFWLPPAHAAAPSHVSAMLSGVVLKMGVYGLVRFLSLVPPAPPAWGALVLLLGGVSALLGVVFAIGQHDLKRLLAYHSVENVGIILMGLGLATLGRSMERPEWVVLGMAGCLLHVWNHGLFKGLLFLCAGSVVHATGTREIDRLGGLGKAMPWTAALFVVGAVAICGLPPLNGFVSELFVYLGLLHSAGGGGGGALAAALVPVLAPVLGMAGALALACFVKVHGAVFLGTARSGAALHAREAPLLMRLPMLVLAAGCGVIGLAPFAVAPVLDPVIRGWTPEPLVRVGSLAPLPQVALLGSLVVVLTGALWLARRPAARAAPEVVTWDCGYARPGPRMQYSASSFADTLVALFRWALRPHVQRASVHGPFPAPSSMRSHVEDPVLDRLILPAGRGAERVFGWFRRFQHGLTQHYLLYVLATVLLMLATLIPFRDLLERLLSR
jgi:hydrogenase-4 component B